VTCLHIAVSAKAGVEKMMCIYIKIVCGLNDLCAHTRSLVAFTFWHLPIEAFGQASRTDEPCQGIKYPDVRQVIKGLFIKKFKRLLLKHRKRLIAPISILSGHCQCHFAGFSNMNPVVAFLFPDTMLPANPKAFKSLALPTC
jgi:hypothetical protein